LATDWIQARPERACEGFIPYHGRAAAQVRLGEFAPRTERDAHRTEIARGNGHEPHARIPHGVRSASRDLDGRRQATAREGREIREGRTRDARERPRRIL